MLEARWTARRRNVETPAAGVVAAVVREPLVQFLAIGAVLAGLYALLPTPPAPAEDGARTIVVSEGEIEQLRQLFGRTWQRPPSGSETDGLVAAFVREEVLYRAGQSLGLDADDPVVRRRVAQKMEFLLEPAPGDLVPTTTSRVTSRPTAPGSSAPRGSPSTRSSSPPVRA